MDLTMNKKTKIFHIFLFLNYLISENFKKHSFFPNIHLIALPQKHFESSSNQSLSKERQKENIEDNIRKKRKF
jgi:hypothetical protein